MHDESNVLDHLYSVTKNVNQMQVEVFVLEGTWVSCTITHSTASLFNQFYMKMKQNHKIVQKWLV